jgi:transposase-like protein
VVRTPQERQQLIRACGESGLSVAEFCREQGISPASFYQWQRTGATAGVRFAEVALTPEPTAEAVPAGHAPLELVLAGGMRIAVRDARWLPHAAVLVRALEARGC